MSQSNNKGVSGKAIGIGAGLVAAAALGTYFLYGSKSATANRKKVKGWMLKAKGEILEKLEKMESVSSVAYDKAVQEVMGRYRTMKGMDAKDVAAFVGDLKKHWKAAHSGAKKRKASPKKRN